MTHHDYDHPRRPMARVPVFKLHDATVTTSIFNDDDLQHYYSDYTLFTIKKQNGDHILLI